MGDLGSEQTEDFCSAEWDLNLENMLLWSVRYCILVLCGWSRMNFLVHVFWPLTLWSQRAYLPVTTSSSYLNQSGIFCTLCSISQQGQRFRLLSVFTLHTHAANFLSAGLWSWGEAVSAVPGCSSRVLQLRWFMESCLWGWGKTSCLLHLFDCWNLSQCRFNLHNQLLVCFMKFSGLWIISFLVSFHLLIFHILFRLIESPSFIRFFDLVAVSLSYWFTLLLRVGNRPTHCSRRLTFLLHSLVFVFLTAAALSVVVHFPGLVLESKAS